MDDILIAYVVSVSCLFLVVGGQSCFGDSSKEKVIPKDPYGTTYLYWPVVVIGVLSGVLQIVGVFTTENETAIWLVVAYNVINIAWPIVSDHVVTFFVILAGAILMTSAAVLSKSGWLSFCAGASIAVDLPVYGIKAFNTDRFPTTLTTRL